MIYSELVNKACNIMFEAHKNDIDNFSAYFFISASILLYKYIVYKWV